jgi:hypothetical protein
VPRNNGSVWRSLELHPLTGVLDVRSRPSDIPPGAYRWILNLSTTDLGKRCRRSGFSAFGSDVLFDANGTPCTTPGNTCANGSLRHNADLHHQGQTRYPISLLYESTDSAGTRQLIAGTQTSLYILNYSSGYWTQILSGQGATGSRWKVAQLQDVAVFVDGVDQPWAYGVDGQGPNSTIPDLVSLGITSASVVIQYQGIMVLMNLVQGPASGAAGTYSSRIQWSDLNLPLSYVPSTSSLAGFQDLDYGDPILAAVPMAGNVYIFTSRSIWVMSVSGVPIPNPFGGGQQQGTSNLTSANIFTFNKIYTEPLNQSGCLAFPNTLISTGTAVWYMAADGIYTYNPYLVEPERPDWLHRADGVIYTNALTAMTGLLCQSPVAWYVPGTREMYFSWPSATAQTLGGMTLNNWTLCAQVEQKTADVIDHGFVCGCNFRLTPQTNECNNSQNTLAVSATDWCIKSFFGVFYREIANLDASGDPAVDLPLNSPPENYTLTGYNTIMRGIVPTGLNDREKIIRKVLLDHDTTTEAEPPVVQLRLGNSYVLVDPNDSDDFCSPMWNEASPNAPTVFGSPAKWLTKLFPPQPLNCSDPVLLSQMRANNLRPSAPALEWPTWVVGNFLFWELTVTNADGTPAIGGDFCAQRVNFDVLAKSKPSQ